VSALSPRRIWRIKYARPFVLLLVGNLTLLAFTLPRGISERRLSARAVASRREIAERRLQAHEMGRREDIIKANAIDANTFYTDFVPDRKDLSSMLKDLQRMATSAGVNARRVTYRPPEDVKGTELVSFEVTMPISGTYQQVGNFLQKLERAKHFIIVNQVMMRGRPGDEGGADLDIRLETYFRGDGTGKGRAPRSWS
jgi:hypothetical protein